MRRFTLFTAALILAVAPIASAKMTTVKGAKCTVCHEGTPKDKKLTAAAKKYFPKFKEEQCKDCHAVVDGKFTTTKKK